MTAGRLRSRTGPGLYEAATSFGSTGNARKGGQYPTGEMSALRKLKRRFVLETRSDDNFIKTVAWRGMGQSEGVAE